MTAALTPGTGCYAGAQILRYFLQGRVDDEPEAMMAAELMIAKALSGLCRLDDFLNNLGGGNGEG